jgi:CheY-like chemotaxis protein
MAAHGSRRLWNVNHGTSAGVLVADANRLAYQWGHMSGFLRKLFGRQEEESPAATAAAAQQARHRQCTVLVIDDDPAFLQVMKPALEGEGYTVLATSSAPKGLNMIRYAPRDIAVVLLDYSMPSLDGAGALTFVRQLNPKLKVIAVTGSEPEMLPAEFRDGVDAFVKKPFKMDELLNLVGQMVDQALSPATPAKSD